MPDDLTSYWEQLDDWWTGQISDLSKQNDEDQGIGREIALEHAYQDTSGWGDWTVDDDELQAQIDVLMGDGDDDEQPTFGPDDEPNPVVHINGVGFVNPLWTEWKKPILTILPSPTPGSTTNNPRCRRTTKTTTSILARAWTTRGSLILMRPRKLTL